MRQFVAVFALALMISSPIIAATRKKPAQPPPLVQTAPPVPPVIQTVAAPPLSWTFGDWTAGDYGDFTLASTVNESGSAFGLACGKTCVWFVNFQSGCEVGKDYPAMINTAAGAKAIQLRCYHLSDRWLLTFPLEENDADAISSGGQIGFAFPLQSGKFGVSRFSLTGGVDATVKAIKVDEQKGNQEGLRDFTI
jgi:hypothetical protein